MKGERPPPCSVFSFTKVDQHRAVLFGGYQPDNGRMNKLYIFNFNGDYCILYRLIPMQCTCKQMSLLVLQEMLLCKGALHMQQHLHASV